MTRDYSQNNHDPGAKKFLYTGPRKRNGFGDDDDVSELKFSSRQQNGTTSHASSGLNLDGMLGLKPNVGGFSGGGSHASKPGVQDGWDRNSHGFYSRHGLGDGAADSSTLTTSKVADPSGKTWPRGNNTHSYSYTTPSGGQPHNNAASPPVGARQLSRGSGLGSYGLGSPGAPSSPQYERSQRRHIPGSSFADTPSATHFDF